VAHLLRGAGVRSRRCEGAGRKLVAGGRRVGTEARRAEAEARRRWSAASERGCGITARGCGARRGRSRAGLRTSDARASGQRDKGLSSWASYWAGPYRQARYVSDGVSNLHENNKKSDTPRIRILGVSDTYPIRIGYAIRGFRDISV